MKVYETLAKAFADEGTTVVFGMMGDANMYWMNELANIGVELVNARHEGAALAMADGFARIAGQPGVCTTTSGPGVAQLATTMIVASRARTPIVAFVGETSVGDDEAVQRLNQERFAYATECGFVRVTSADDAAEATRKAFYLAQGESRPIMLNAPMDVQQLRADDDDQPYIPSSTLLNTKRVFPNPETIESASDIIADAERPVIIVGRGAIKAEAGESILQLADKIGALIATTLMAKTWLVEDEYHVGISGLYATRTAMELFQEADCVIGIGASLNKYTTEHGYLFPKARYVQLDTKPHLVMGGGGSADCYLQADALLGVQALCASLDQRGVHATGFRTPEVKGLLAGAFVDDEHYEIEPGTVDPREVCHYLDEVVPGEIGLVLGGGQNICFSTMLMTRRRSLVLANQHFGCIGQGLTTAMGAVIANDKRPAFLMEGDAGLMMHLAEFETAVRYELPLLVIVMNDQQLGAEYHKARAKGLAADLAQVSTPDLGAVGRALGGRGGQVRSIDDLHALVAEFVADPAPTLVDVRISTNVVSIPYRRLHFGQEA